MCNPVLALVDLWVQRTCVKPALRVLHAPNELKEICECPMPWVCEAVESHRMPGKGGKPSTC